MQHFLYLDRVLMPVTPSAVQVKINNKNKVFDLANGSELNMLNPPGLTRISFDLLIPSVEYPFAQYENGFIGAGYYLNHLENLKCSCTPFELMIIRTVSARTALKFAASVLPYSEQMANAITGNTSGRITAADAQILLKNEQTGSSSYISDTTMSVTLEEYTIHEDAEKYGKDFFVSVELLQYREHYDKTVVLKKT